MKHKKKRAPENGLDARFIAERWKGYTVLKPISDELNCQSVVDPMRARLLTDIEARILDAFKTGDAGFFRQFAGFIERYKDPCPVRMWLFSLHSDSENFRNMSQVRTFTHNDLVALAKKQGFYPGRDDDNILRQLKRFMKEEGFTFKNSPK